MEKKERGHLYDRDDCDWIAGFFANVKEMFLNILP